MFLSTGQNSSFSDDILLDGDMSNDADLSVSKHEDTTSPNLNQSTTSASEHKSAFIPVGANTKKKPIKYSHRSPRRARNFITGPVQCVEQIRKREPLPIPRGANPQPFNPSVYGIVARLWMEQVDIKTVQKSQTMYLSIMPPGTHFPEQLMQRLKYEAQDDEVFSPPQWAMARSRTMRRRTRKSRMSDSFGGGVIDELDSSQPGRQGGVLFFQVGTRWKELAWELFNEDVQSESETVRMITDIELKNPGKLDDQVLAKSRKFHVL